MTSSSGLEDYLYDWYRSHKDGNSR